METHGSPGMSLSNPFPLPSLSERVKEHVQDGTDTLYIYPNACADALKEWFR